MSVYQNNGKPLSQQALYQQKLRQGVYSNPGKPSVGVSSNASDTAALLAASSDLTVNPSYERSKPAADAQTAALAAKKNETTAWKRESTDPYADAAAASAKVKSATVKKSKLGLPDTYDKTSVFTKAQSNSANSMTSRSTPEKLVSKHGLASKQTASTSPLNIGKISQLADQNSSLMISKRFNPENDYRSGINTSKSEAAAVAAANTTTPQLMRHGLGYSDSQSSQRRSLNFQASEVVDAALLAAASAKASERLNSISSASTLDIRERAQAYSKALTAAQKNSETRLNAHKTGMVDLGGGLLLPIGEVDKLANLIVQPVLDDLSSKAEAQRESDDKQKKKWFELTQLHQKSKKEDEEQKLAEKAERERAKEARIAAHEEEKSAEDEKVREFEAEKRAVYDGKAAELSELKETHASEQEELNKEREENEARIREEESGLIEGRKNELEEMQAEKDEILKPVNEELETETSKLNEVTAERDTHKSEYDEIQKINDERAAKVAELKQKLEEANKGIEQHNALLLEVVPKREALDSEVGELEESSKAKLLNAEQSKTELDKDVADLEKQKLEYTTTKASTKKEILDAHQQRVVDAHKINDELPEHMREPINEKKLLDTSSLFSVEKKVEAAKEEPKVSSDKASRRKSFRQKLSGIKSSLLPSSS